MSEDLWRAFDLSRDGPLLHCPYYGLTLVPLFVHLDPPFGGGTLAACCVLLIILCLDVPYSACSLTCIKSNEGFLFSCLMMRPFEIAKEFYELRFICIFDRRNQS